MAQMRKLKGMPAWVATAVLLWAAPAYADDAGDKLVRGLANTFLGFLEIPRNIHTTTEDKGVLTGWTAGLGKGLGYTVLRMGVGIYEIVTFPFPLPENYESIVEPDFVWDAEGPSLGPEKTD